MKQLLASILAIAITVLLCPAVSLSEDAIALDGCSYEANVAEVDYSLCAEASDMDDEEPDDTYDEYDWDEDDWDEDDWDDEEEEEDQGIAITAENFPDRNFRNAVTQFDLDDNGFLNEDEIYYVSSLEVDSGKIKS